MTAIAPSPTADATRLADSARTSPAAKTPGTLVSRWNGWRSRFHPGGSCAVHGQVRAGEDEAARVADHACRRASRCAARAPMNTNSQPASTVSVSPVVLVPQRDLLELLVAVRLDDLGAGAHVDVLDRRSICWIR